MDTFCLETETLKMNLEMARVDELLLHEDIIPVSANRLIMEFSHLETLRNPIVVEKNGVVLDGNHRVYAFRELGFRFIPICKIDYYSTAAKLKYWFRLIRKLPGLDMVMKTFKQADVAFYPMPDKSELKQAMQGNHLAFGFQYQADYTLAEFPKQTNYDAVGVYDAIQVAQHAFTEGGSTLQYIPCTAVDEIDFNTGMNVADLVVWTPQITKQMVIEAAKANKIFAPKTTRHLIPERPLNVDVPGTWLRENVALDDINRRFKAYLEQKQIKRFGPGQVIDGRFYEEALYVFLSR